MKTLTLRSVGAQLRAILNGPGLYCGKHRVSKVWVNVDAVLVSTLNGWIPVATHPKYSNAVSVNESFAMLKSGDGNDKPIWRIADTTKGGAK